ncbi:MAG: hypothetical protein ACYCW6_22335, partial [Candidatus Xenobia bacterium]
ERHRVASWLARSVRDAADANPSNWSLSLFEREVRLNVGKGQVLTLSPGMVLAMVDAEAVSRQVREELWGMLELPSREFTSVGDEKGLARVSARVLQQVEPMLLPAHLAFIRNASATAKSTPFRRSHSGGLLKYLRQLLDDGFLPDPEPPPRRRL